MVFRGWVVLLFAASGHAGRMRQSQADEAAGQWWSSDVDKAKAQGGCWSGMHMRLDRSMADRHVVNPLCKVYEGYDEECEEHHIILALELRNGQVLEGPCREMVRGPDILGKESDDVWDISIGLDHLYGNIAVKCVDSHLSVVEYSCRENLPFSVIQEYDPEPMVSRYVPDWLRLSQLSHAWASREIAIYDCDRASDAVIVSSHTVVESPDNFFKEAVGACALEPTCVAVALERERAVDDSARYHLLSSLSCAPSTASVFPRFSRGHKVVNRMISPTLALGTLGTVLEDWHPSVDDLVQVDFQGIGRRKVPATNLDPVFQESTTAENGFWGEHLAPWLVVDNVRERETVCEKMTPGWSCDVNSRADAAILFTNASNSSEAAEQCRRACEETASSSGLTAACCVLTDGICALTEGQYFELRTGDPFDLDDVAYPQKAENKDPDSFEVAASCEWRLCSQDPLCTHLPQEMHNQSDTMLPDDAVVPDGNIKLYFDFAHPLSQSFTHLNGFHSHSANIYHFTSKDGKIAEKALRDKSRAVRVIGSVAPSDLSALAEAKKQRTGFNLASGFPTEDQLSKTLGPLDLLCQRHGSHFDVELTAPRFGVEMHDTCVGQHGSPSSPGFEPCMMRLGCQKASPEEDLIPFHGPFFSRLPYDMLAWQQPAPMCCGKSLNLDLRDEHLRAEFFEEIGFQEPDKVDLHLVDSSGVRGAMSDSLKVGARAMKHLLAHELAGDQSVLKWLGKFIIRVRHALGKFMRELTETMDSEGDVNGDTEISEDGQSFLHLHDHGDTIAPSGRRAVEVARWSQERGAFIQLAVTNSTLQSAWSIAKLVPGAVYNYGIKPVWTHVLKPLAKWGLSITKWMLEHPRVALFISKIALAVRDRMCEKASWYVYGSPEAEAVGAFSKIGEKAAELQDYLSTTFSPAVLLTGLQKVIFSSKFMDQLVGIGKSAFGIALSWAGFATGGAAAVFIGSIASMFATAAMDASQMAVEFMVYQEIAKEIPSNLYDMLMGRCIFERDSTTHVTFGATVNETVGAAKDTIVKVSRKVKAAGDALSNSMGKYEGLLRR